MSGLGGIDARERDPAASDGGRSECDKREATLLLVRPRIFIGGGLVASARETEKERGREDLVRDWERDRVQEAEVRDRE